MNTKVTVTYANGTVREFRASNELEKLILEGNMFSITTGFFENFDEELKLSKMYAGNPMAALGNVLIMRDNSVKLSIEHADEQMKMVTGLLDRIIGIIANEMVSYQSGMVDPRIQVCEHGKKLDDYCEPCGRIHNG